MSPKPEQFPLPENFPPTETLYFPPITPTASSPLLFFLPGNPGLVNYYTSFLTQLSIAHPSLHILAASHAGFHPDEPQLHKGYSWKWGPQPWGLDAQVKMKTELLQFAVEKLGDKNRKVLLMAHSMGAYLSLEMITGLKKATEEGSKILGGIMLFPTVLEIADSPQGRLLTPLLGSRIVRGAASWAAWGFSWCKEWQVEMLVKVLTGQDPEAAETTRQLVTTPHVVEQALVLAEEEMRRITTDRWEEEVWGCEGRMVYVFGQKDHWVAEKTREGIMAKARGGGKYVLEETGLKHGFCVSQGERMAEVVKVKGWINDIIGEEK
jgi:pimeloyl-ACP methyl ester carboxylesterase